MTDPSMFIQWKGTDVCMDFHCSCQEGDGYSSHFDGYFAYAVKCPKCGAVYELGSSVEIRRVEGTDYPTVVLDYAKADDE